MKSRCYNPNNPRYNRYGARGIVVCDKWLHSFAAFFEDMGPRPGNGYSIDRKNNDGNYCPENCRWATTKEQNSNRGDLRLIQCMGRTQTLTEWSRETGIGIKTISGRLDDGWSPELAITSPVAPRRWRGKPGTKIPIRELAPGEGPYRGVSKFRSAWVANIHVNGRSVFLGNFSDPIDAAVAYDNEAKRIGGKRLNFTDVKEIVMAKEDALGL